MNIKTTKALAVFVLPSSPRTLLGKSDGMQPWNGVTAAAFWHLRSSERRALRRSNRFTICALSLPFFWEGSWSAIDLVLVLRTLFAAIYLWTGQGCPMFRARSRRISLRKRYIGVDLAADWSSSDRRPSSADDGKRETWMASFETGFTLETKRSSCQP